jgi:prepilin-type N-terminal cleavage/methylation domain-containing protein/prepilin-type processing-associated H-X9-DG protein
VQQVSKRAFTLIELLVVIAIIAILAAILFPVFAQVRDRARMSACLSNMKQIGTSLMLYVQDYDETYPYIRFHGADTPTAERAYVWKNAILPYLKSHDVLACPSNPVSRAVPGQHGNRDSPKPGDNAEGWQSDPGLLMPISYGMNSCASSWYPADDRSTGPPVRLAQLQRPTETIIISESQWGASDVHGENWLLDHCGGVFTHPAGKQANFIFYDGHARSKKWLATLYPVSQNNWMANTPPQDPNNRRIFGAPGCDRVVPAGPDASVFRSRDCLAYQ